MPGMIADDGVFSECSSSGLAGRHASGIQEKANADVDGL